MTTLEFAIPVTIGIAMLLIGFISKAIQQDSRIKKLEHDVSRVDKNTLTLVQSVNKNTSNINDNFATLDRYERLLTLVNKIKENSNDES